MLWILLAILGGIIAGFIAPLAPDTGIERPMNFGIVWVVILSLWGTIIKARQVRANPEREVIQALAGTDPSEHTRILNEMDAVRKSWWQFFRLTSRFFRGYAWSNAITVCLVAIATFWLRRLL